MNTDLISLVLFVLITTFTPGPNNITCAVMGLNYGYKKTLRFMVGIVCGFFLIMNMTAILSSSLMRIIPRVERYLAVAGALYIVWLAWHTLRANYAIHDQERPPLGFINGFLLQLVNPKSMVYGMTLFSTFLKDLPRNSLMLPLTTTALAVIGFGSISIWTLFGTAISRFMRHDKVKLGINIALSLLLLITAVQISGILEYI